jgi:hypothetical protein
MARWNQELRRAFGWAQGDLGLDHKLPDAFYRAVRDVLGAERGEVDFIYPVEYEQTTAYLIVRAKIVWLAAYESGATTIRFVGDLRGGRYTERLIDDKEGGFDIEATYHHRRLGRGKPLRAHIEERYFPPGTFTSDETDYALERAERLRETFRLWSIGETSRPSDVG